MELQTTTERLSDTHPDVARKMAQRLHRKKDDIQIVRKFYLADEQKATDEERAITARVSTPDVDRDGEVILPEGIDTTEYVKNSVLLWAHDYTTPAIGRSMWPPKVDKAGMVCKFQFAKTQFADEIYQLYRDGYMRAFSIGFIPIEYDPATKTHKRISLLEVSAVPVPCNQNALVMEAYGKGIIKSAVLKRDFEIPDEPEPVADEAVEELKSAIADVEMADPVPDEPAVEPVEDKAGDAATETFTGPAFEVVPDAPEAPVESVPVPEPDVKAADDEPDVDGPYECECIACGHKVTSDKHCKDMRCPECGGEMRRAERPGPGRSVGDDAAVKNDPLRELADSIRDALAHIAAQRQEPPVDPERAEAQGEADDSVPYMLADLLLKMDALIEAVVGIRQDLADERAAYLTVDELPATDAPAVAVDAPAPVAKDDPAPEPVAVDVRAVVAEAMKSLDVKAISEQAAALALAKLRGKVAVD